MDIFAKHDGMIDRASAEGKKAQKEIIKTLLLKKQWVLNFWHNLVKVMNQHLASSWRCPTELQPVGMLCLSESGTVALFWRLGSEPVTFTFWSIFLKSRFLFETSGPIDPITINQIESHVLCGKAKGGCWLTEHCYLKMEKHLHYWFFIPNSLSSWIPTAFWNFEKITRTGARWALRASKPPQLL